MTQTLFREEALDQQRDRLWGDVILTQPLSLRIFSVFAVLVLVALIAYLVWGSYTRKETVQGYLTPNLGLVQLYAPQPGTLSELLVESGQTVDEGEVLMKVRTERSLGNGSSLDALLIDLLDVQRQRLESRIERIKEQRVVRKAHLQDQIEGAVAQIEQLQDQQQLQQERLELAKTRYQALETLKREQLIAESDYQDRYQAYLDERQRLEQLEQSMITEESRLGDARFELASLAPETAEQIDQLEAEISRIEQQRVQYRGEQSFSIEAPISGRVTSLQVVPGQNVDVQKPMLAILPKGGALRAELFVPTQAIGFIEPELEVKLRYDAFPYERFGVYRSHITQVAKTVLAPQDVNAPLRLQQPVYRVTAQLDEQELMAYGRHFPLQAGMTLEADILLDERPLYQWLLKPLYSLRGAL